MTAGVTGTVSIAVIVFEVTNQIDFALPILMVSTHNNVDRDIVARVLHNIFVDVLICDHQCLSTGDSRLSIPSSPTRVLMTHYNGASSMHSVTRGVLNLRRCDVMQAVLAAKYTVNSTMHPPCTTAWGRRAGSYTGNEGTGEITDNA